MMELPVDLARAATALGSKLTPDRRRELILLLQLAVQAGRMIELNERLVFLNSKLGGAGG